MTNEELNAAIADISEFGICDDSDHIGHLRIAIQAARELSQLKDGTHPDMVMVPRKATKTILKAMFESVGMVRQSRDMIRTYDAAIAAAQKGDAK